MRASLLLMTAAVALALAGPAARVAAHELTPALLSLEEETGGRYRVLWRVPRDEAPRALLRPVLPPASETLEEPTTVAESLAVSERWVVRIPGGIAGAPLGLDGPPGARTDALVRVALRDGRVLHGRLSPGGPPFVVPREPGAGAIAATYLRLGVEHILLGFDHLLFVLGLLLLTRSAGALVKTITAFTAAHSLTLALATLGLLSVPGPPVEATIALSIVFVARALVLDKQASVAARRPWLVALAFGLLHGLGFASALAQVGLPRREVPLALLAFNLGVELGQLAFVAALGIVWSLVGRRLLAPAARGPWRGRLGYGIGSLAAALCLARVAAFAVR